LEHSIGSHQHPTTIEAVHFICVRGLTFFSYLSFWGILMNRFILINALLLIVLAVTCAAQSRLPDDKGFEIVKTSGDISIYERWITFPKSSPPVRAREVKGVFYARATIDKGLELLRNESKIQEWQSHVSKFKVFPQTDSTWYEYSYHDIPWPVSDQDHFLIYKIEENIPGKRLFVTFESIVNPILGPIDEDAARMTLAGSWAFETQGDKIKITYRILSMPSSIPKIFTDPVIRSNMMSTIKSYVKLVEQKPEALLKKAK
jgi:hypothetical protein